MRSASIAFAGETYTFPVILKSKDECKNGGWARSTDPVFKNQGQCVSTFASAKATAEPTPEPIVAPQPAATASITKFMTKIWPFA